MNCRLKLFMTTLLCVLFRNLLLGQGEAAVPEIVKTIQREEGDVVDCIDVSKQPSLEHPLLKSHKIQMQPGALPTKMMGNSDVKLIRESFGDQLRSVKETCPLGTVPIHRTTKRDIRRAKALARKLSLSRSTTSINDGSSDPSKCVGIMMTLSQTPIYSGIFGSTPIYNLTVEKDQTSTASVWANDTPMINSIFAGSLVSHDVTGDSIPRLFVYWTGNDRQPCYNFFCKGFVQVSRDTSPNDPIRSLSTYGGQTQDVKFSIFQDRTSGNWWFAFNDNHVGYWPKEIVPNLKDGANEVGLGGLAVAGRTTGLSPPTGSGHFPDGQYNNHAAYFKQVHYYINQSVVPQVPLASGTQGILVGSGCYGLENDGNSGDQQRWGYRFLYGGPGGSC